MFEELFSNIGNGFILAVFMFSIFNLINKQVEESSIVFEHTQNYQALENLLRTESFEELCQKAQNEHETNFRIENIKTGERCETMGFGSEYYNTFEKPKQRLIISAPKAINDSLYKVSVYE